MGHIVAIGKIRVINITPRYATLTYCANYVSGGIDVNLGILIKMYWDTAMRVMDTDMTETMIIIIMVTTV